MNNHTITNKMAAVAAHLRMAETYSICPRVIDEVRAALCLVLDVGESCGNELAKEQEA